MRQGRVRLRNTVFFWIIPSISKIGFRSVKYTQVTWLKRWSHQSTLFIKEYLRCKVQQQTIAGTRDCSRGVHPPHAYAESRLISKVKGVLLDFIRIWIETFPLYVIACVRVIVYVTLLWCTRIKVVHRGTIFRCFSVITDQSLSEYESNVDSNLEHKGYSRSGNSEG